MKIKRLYSLFELQSGQWVRIRSNAYPIEKARRVWQDSLLAHALGLAPERRLKPVKQSF